MAHQVKGCAGVDLETLQQIVHTIACEATKPLRPAVACENDQESVMWWWSYWVDHEKPVIEEISIYCTPCGKQYGRVVVSATGFDGERHRGHSRASADYIISFAGSEDDARQHMHAFLPSAISEAWDDAKLLAQGREPFGF